VWIWVLRGLCRGAVFSKEIGGKGVWVDKDDLRNSINVASAQDGSGMPV
jgi:hypothetical protein